MITVELLEEFGVWVKNRKRIPDNKIVNLKIRFGEVELGKKIGSFGGEWNKKKIVWELKYICKIIKSNRQNCFLILGKLFFLYIENIFYYWKTFSTMRKKSVKGHGF